MVSFCAPMVFSSILVTQTVKSLYNYIYIICFVEFEIEMRPTYLGLGSRCVIYGQGKESGMIKCA